MKRAWLSVFLVGLGALAAPCPAQSGRNAATWYQRAIDRIDRLSLAENALLDAYRAQPGLPPSPDVRAILARLGPMMDLAVRGGQQPYSDFELAYSDGFSLTLPHLGSLRRISSIMQADAYVRLHDGDVRGAADRIATLYQMGAHAGHDRLAISSLVGQAIWRAGDEALQAALDRGTLGPADAAVVLRAARDMPAHDPFSYVEGTVMEQELAVATLERLTRDGEEGLAQLAEFLPDGEAPPELAAMTHAELEADVERFRGVMDEITEIFATGDPEAGPEALRAIEEALERGEYGALCQLFLPAFGKLFELKLRAEQQIRDRIATLAALAAGERDARDEANAAHWYLAAIDAMAANEAMDAETLTLLRRADRDPDADVGAPLVSALESCGDVLELLRTAAGMKRCDFSFILDAKRTAPIAAPSYAPGLRDLLRLVHVEARRRLGEGDHDGLVDRLRIAWSMIIHLQADPMLSIAIMTHGAFNRTVDVVTSAAKRDLLTPADRTEIAGLVRHVRRTDPFGYVGAIVQARADLTAHSRRMIPYTTDNRPLRDRIAEEVKGLDGDTLLYVAVVMDTMAHASDDDFAAHCAALAPLDDVFDLEVLARSRSDVPVVAPRLAAHDVLGLGALEAPDIAAIRRRMEQGRVDLRRGLLALEPPSDGAAHDSP